MNINKLKGKIIENEMNIAELARKIGVDRSTLYRKLDARGESLSIKEANQIRKVLKLTTEESIAIFFNQNVAYHATISSEEGAEC